MNIKNRLKKLETQYSSQTGMCECYEKHTAAIIAEIFDSPYSPEDLVALPHPPDAICKRCGRPVDVERIDNIDEKIRIIYGNS